MRVGGATRPRCAGGVAAVLLAATLGVAGCGSSETTVEAGTAPALTVPSVQVTTAGDPAIALVAPGGGSTAVTFAVDDAGLLIVDVTLRSSAPRPADVILSADCRDAAGTTIATATGGTVFLQPGGVRTVALSARPPERTIASALITVTTHPSVGVSPS